MRSKLAVSALVAAALFGVTANASAQPQPTPAASGQDNLAAATTKSTMTPGTTTGSATKVHTNKGVLPNPSHLDSHDSGDSRGK
jgi:hypothetical protein